MNLEIYIVNFLKPELTQRCIDSIVFTVPHKLKITVMDNSPTVTKFRNLNQYYHFPFNPSLTRVWNWSIAMCKTDWIALVDHDAVFQMNWINTFNDELHMRKARLHNYSYAQFIHRSLIKQIGWFDERFTTFYFEDVDFMRRVHNAGFHMCLETKEYTNGMRSCPLNYHILHKPPSPDDPVFFKYSSVVAGVRGDVFYEQKWGDRINDVYAKGEPKWENKNWYPIVKFPDWPYEDTPATR